MRLQQWTRYPVLAAALGLSMAACGDATGPASDFDAQAVAETVEAMVSAAETDELGEAYGSLQLADYLFSGVSVDLAVTAPLGLDAASVASFAAPPGEPAADVIPTEYHGTTFQWDEGEGAYVASDITGAPSDGVRVIFYVLDPATGMPASPLELLGYVDLRDLSTTDVNRISVEVIQTVGSTHVTLASYTLDVAYTFEQTSLAIDGSMAGYLSDGTDQVDFELSQALLFTETEISLDQAYTLDLDGTASAMSFTSSSSTSTQSPAQEPDNLEATTEITNGDWLVVIESTWSNSTLEGTITEDGETKVLISGGLDDPTFTDTAENPLTQEQQTALESIWDALGRMFDFAETMFSFLSL